MREYYLKIIVATAVPESVFFRNFDSKRQLVELA